MYIQNLRDKYPKLIAFLTENGYSKNYVQRLQGQINTILSNYEISSLGSYNDIYCYYAERSTSKQGLRQRLTSLGIIERFDLRGEFPDGRTRQKIKERGVYQNLSPEFKSVIDTYREYEETRGVKKKSTIYGEAHNAASFLNDLQCAEIRKPEDITQQSVICVFLNEDGTIRRSCSFKKIIAAVLRGNVSTNPKLYNRLIAYLPDLRESRKNIQYLTNAEIVEVKRVLAMPDSGLSLRDKAIGILALRYGLRCCDISKLKIEEVDLDNDEIKIRQQKTAALLVLPLTTSAGNAIYDYACFERPKNDCEFVFLSENRPYGRLAAGSIGNIASKIMNIAGIRQNSEDRRGLHIFRHRLATDLLNQDVPQPVISRLVGHDSPKSLEIYLSSNFARLKECTLSIERFPVREEVFANA